MKYHYHIIVVVFCFLLAPLVVISQNQEGSPFIRNYSPKEYSASSGNWVVAQDQRGIMYFGNAEGVLEYDGNTWRLIPVTNNSVVRSIAIDNSGIIYVGAVGEFGFLSPNEKGLMTYHSLVNKLPIDEQDFRDVWKTYATSDGVYFQTFSKLIRIKNNIVKIWKPENSFHFSYFVRNKLYINEKGLGLKEMIGDKLQLVNRGSIFSDQRIYSMLSYAGNSVLIATREKGLYLMKVNRSEKDSAITHLNTKSNESLINDQVYGGVALKNEKFAFATLTNGVMIIGLDGEIVQVLNKKNGLQDDIVKYVATDKQNDLWVALGKGISHVEISSPLSSINDAQGLNGFVEDIIKHKGSLYVATSLGLFVSIDNHFVPVNGINSQTWSLQKFITKKDTLLLVSCESGIFEIKNTTSSLIQENFGFVLKQSKKEPKRLFIGMGDGISSIKYENNNWIDEDYLKGIDIKIQSIAEDEKGDLWLGTPVNGVMKIKFDSGKITADSLITSWNSVYKIFTYDTINGLPEMENNIPYNFKNKIVFTTDSGIYEFNEKTVSFFHSSLLKTKIGHSQVYRFAEKDSSAIWMFTVKPGKVKETGVAYLDKDSLYTWYTQPFKKISDWEIHAIYPDENQITWLGAPDGLLRYDANIKKDFAIPFYTLIREVRLEKDSLLFGGNFYNAKNGINLPVIIQQELLKPIIDYKYNTLTFSYSATNFSDNKNNSFSFYLEGHDKGWSEWSKKYEKEYSDLKEASYTFHIKSKSIYGVDGTESAYSFTILPPWYRTIWAYIAYVIAIVGSIYLIVKISVRRLVKAKNQLESIVKERTAEVVEQKHLIEEKHKEITDSINYAERIQRSFLATKELLDDNLKDYFVFFKPKDVVSGDFYWAANIVNSKGIKNFALVTADSTGHGVPGAIMSLLNITSLEKAIEHHQEPADILNYTRKNIIERLKKDGSAEGGKDGMDASLVCFDFLNNTLTFSAANNPVWIVRSLSPFEGGAHRAGDVEVIETKPDKMPVGKHDRQDVPFTQHEIILQKGDVVYTLTDGFPDQFGGDKGKKFMSKNLRELLAKNSHLPMQEQKELLEDTFTKWVGNLEQIDDVCLIGVRI